jgi:hypothetical protein
MMYGVEILVHGYEGVNEPMTYKFLAMISRDGIYEVMPLHDLVSPSHTIISWWDAPQVPSSHQQVPQHIFVQHEF